MEREEFLEKVKKVLGSQEIKENKISVEWETGGVSGGSCWGGELSSYSSEEPEPEFKSLDKILEELCPNISYLKYKSLVSECVTRSSRESGDYYGNSNQYESKSYESKSIDLDHLLKLLQSKKLI